jgi:hypothetical protein
LTTNPGALFHKPDYAKEAINQANKENNPLAVDASVISSRDLDGRF